MLDTEAVERTVGAKQVCEMFSFEDYADRAWPGWFKLAAMFGGGAWTALAKRDPWTTNEAITRLLDART